MKFLLTCLLSFSLLGCATANADSYPITVRVDKERLIKIQGTMSGNMLDKAVELDNLSNESRDPVYILINSPGGSVIPTMIFLTAMDVAKQRGVDIVCIVPVLAASAAFQVLANCDERYVFERSLLLFHPVVLSASLNPDQLAAEAEDTKKMQDMLTKELLEVLTMDREAFWLHFYNETLWRAADLMALNPGVFKTIVNVENVPPGELFYLP